VNAGGGKVAIVSVGELYLVMLVEERLLLSQWASTPIRQEAHTKQLTKDEG
jgi:hypothetical protein